MYLIAFLIITSVILSAVLFYVYRTRNHSYWNKNGVPLASGLHWFFGHYKESVLGQRHFANVFRDIYNEYRDAPYIGVMRFSDPALLVRDPDVIKSVLSTDFYSFEENEFKVNAKHDFLMGYNPFVLQGQEWKMSRGHASPLTTFAKLKMYYPTVMKVSKELTNFIKSKLDERGVVELEAKQLSGMYTTDVVANAVFGVHNDTFKDHNSLFAQVTKEIFASGTIDVLRMGLAFAFPTLGNFVGYRISSKKSEDVLMPLTKRIMKQRAQSGEIRNDIFQAMINYRENDTTGVFTDEYIASHCYGFITDGYETSSAAMCFTLFELAWNSDVQDRLRDEITDLIKDTKDGLTIEHVEKCKYLDMVVSEALRMHPPLTVMSKLCTSDYTLTCGKPLKIKKGTFINIPSYAIHMDEKYYPAPEKFDPERFTDEAIEARHKFTYLPFGEGPRKCIGQRFGLLQVKVGVMSIIQNFKITPSPKSNYPVQLDPMDFLSRPLNGAWVQFEPINK